MKIGNIKKYCFDASTIITGWRLTYRPVAFGQVWDRVGDKIKDGTILIPEEVRREIGAGDDPLSKWLKQFNTLIIPITREQILVAKEIVNKYPLSSQYKKPRAYHADPFVVAVAKVNSCAVVTQETRDGNLNNPKIPVLCEEYGIDCYSMSDFFEKEGWRFNLSS